MKEQQSAEVKKTEYVQIAPGVWGMKIVFVNVYMISVNAAAQQWILVDGALKGSSGKIRKMASALFGDVPPAAIVLTHGHFDHIGAIKELLTVWNVPVYAHPLEMPYLTGKSSYPPPDPGVGGGLMSLLSFTYPKKPIDLGKQVRRLPAANLLPGTTDWQYIHTPGHSPGHISLFRESDKVLIAGDAFVTTKPESAFSVITQKKQLSGPPKYFTSDWGAAGQSVSKLAELHPAIAATGHGQPMQGQELELGLQKLTENFEKMAVPVQGRYVNEPAVANRNGVKYIPPRPFNPALTASIFAITALTAYAIYNRVKSSRKDDVGLLVKMLKKNIRVGK